MRTDKKNNWGQASLVAALAAVMAVLVVPLPHALLDFFLGLNILFAFSVLLVSVSITDVLNLSTIPTLLLLCSIFRLALNIASARLILATGDGGEIIHAFGFFVTKGNLVVGFILFIMLMLVQFLVVAKGSERVAEVAARFALDGMPGRQMSIDADLRSGLITAEMATQSRDELLRESRLYAALDGAMKFVKGETVFGFVVLIINLIAGLLIGVLQRGLDITQAGQAYSILTIGEGLVSSLPALMVGVASGFILTRVGSASGQAVGTEMSEQLTAKPRVLWGVAMLSFLLAFVPHFPRLLFIFLAFGTAAVAAVIHLRQSVLRRSEAGMARHVVDNKRNADNLGVACPLMIELSPQLYSRFLADKRWQWCFDELYPELKSTLARERGVPLPELKISANRHLPDSHYRICIFESVVAKGDLDIERCVVRLHDHRLPELSPGEESEKTRHGTPLAHLSLERENEMRARGYQVQAPEDILLRSLAQVLRKHVADYVGIQTVRTILNEVEKVAPELVREVVPRLISLQKMTEVVRRLVEEEVSVRNFSAILEILSSVQADARDPLALVELVRKGLRRQITQKHVQADGTIAVFLLDPDLEELLRGAERKDGLDSYLSIDPEKMTEILQAVRYFLMAHDFIGKQAVLLVSPDIRRLFRKVIENDFYDVAVLTFHELEPHVMINQLDVISLHHPKAQAVS